MNQEQRCCIGPRRAHMKGMDALSIDHCLDGIEHIEARLDGPPVEGIGPLGDETAQVPEVGAEFPAELGAINISNRVEPARRAKSLNEIDQDIIRNVDRGLLHFWHARTLSRHGAVVRRVQDLG